LSLSAEAPGEALERDESLLDRVEPGGSVLVRWYIASSPAVVVGLGLRNRLADAVDLERCRRAGIEVLERRAGGGAVLLDEQMLCAAVCVALPHARVTDDLTASYRWLGDVLASALHQQGFLRASRVDVDAARQDVARLKARTDPVARGLLAACYGALSPHEVTLDGAKVVGLAQVRRRRAALFQAGVLLRDQSPLADLLRMPDEASRGALRDALRQRTAGLPQLDGERLMRDIDRALGV
jgi:lipoate-protein ligase A